ncbi:hypothetical protein ONZ51_g8272 [Trametes cubensis]|uniref:F-box domain-containing protein n=1 Tax=Trametes cubensis TaxID=1111947 RepID=A0AAD7TNK0_9APHY|nr:hypothetical protein ONZ51_g8272 [Trametes cubensis]
MGDADHNIHRPPHKELVSNAQLLREGLISERASGQNTFKLADLYNMRQLLDESRAILRELNDRPQPINKLPPEILCHIFTLVPDDVLWMYSIARAHPTFMLNVAQYYPLLLTCQHWYRLISGTSSFWSTVVDQLVSEGPETLYQNYIARCPTGPLCIFVPEGASDALLDDCRSVEFRGRVKQLSFACQLLDRSDNSGDLLYYSFPALDTCLLLRYSCPDTGADSIQARRILPDSHQLRCLRIRDTNIIPTTPFPALKEFRLQGAYLDRRFEALLCAFLSNCPHLRILELETFIVRESTDISRFESLPPPRDKVTLRSLRTLILSQDFFGVVEDSTLTSVGRLMEWFGGHVVVPPSCSFRIKLALYEDLAAFHALFNLTDAASTATLACELQTWQGGRSRRLSLEAWTEHKVHLAFEVRGYMIRAPYELESDEAREEYLARAVTDEVRDGRARFCSSLSSSPIFNALKRLRVGADASWALLQPFSILVALPRLEFLTIADPIGGSEAHFRHTTADVLSTLVSEQASGLPCPMLRSLIVDCDYTSANTRELPEVDKPEQLSQQIKEIAATRASLGHPLDRLFYLFVIGGGGGVIASEPGALCLHEYDGTSTLIRTVHGDVEAREIVEREWGRR